MTPGKKEPDAWVETLLAAYPAEAKDNDFTARVMARIALQERRRILTLAPFFIAAFVVLVVFFPYQLFEGSGKAIVTGYENFLPYLVPAGAAALMFLFSWFAEEAA